MNKQWGKLITTALVLILLMNTVAVSLPNFGLQPVQAAPPAPNLIVGLFRFMAALEQRNRVYAEARATAEEINQYYDQLSAQTDQMRREMVASAATGDTHPRFARAYTRIGAALEAERRAAIDMIEAEKQQARQDFLRRLGSEIRGILIGSPGGQKVLTEIREAIGGIREAAVAVQIAAEGGKPTNMLGEALARKVGGMGIVKDAARELGSMAGHQIDKGLGGLVSRIEGVIDNINTEVDGVIDWLDDMDSTIAQHQEQSREPISLVGNRSHTNILIPVDRAAAAIDIAANAFARAAEQSGNLEPGMTRDTMIDRIRADLLDARLSGIGTVVSGTLSGRVYCTGVGRGEYELAAKILGQVPEVSPNPEQARYIVCYDLETGAPQSARLFGSVVAEKEDQDEPTINVPEDATLFGRYEGETGWKGPFGAEQILEDRFVIDIYDDGSVAGFFKFNYIMPSQYLDEDCTYQIQRAMTTTITSGTLVDNKATLTADSIYTICENILPCIVPIEVPCPFDGQVRMEIELVNGRLEGYWYTSDWTINIRGKKQ
jgi:hypothetical protein